MERITLKYKGPKCRGFAGVLTDSLKIVLYVYFPFLFEVIDSKGDKLKLE